MAELSSLSIPSSSYTASGVLQRPCTSMLRHWVPLQNSPGLQSLQQRSPEKYSSLLQSKRFSFCLEGRSEQTLLRSWKKIRDSLRLLVTAEGGQIMVEKGHTQIPLVESIRGRDYGKLCCRTLEPAVAWRRLHNRSLQGWVALCCLHRSIPQFSSSSHEF